MSNFPLLAFLPELVLVTGSLALFCATLGQGRTQLARGIAYITALATLGATVLSFNQAAVLFDGAYQVDAFSQLLKLILASGFLLVVLLSDSLPDIRPDIKPEYYFLLTVSVIGLILLVSCVELITIIVALETAAFPLYLMVPMRREREGQRAQMESAMKYMMFGIAANGIMFFGLSYLFGLTGTTSLPVLMQKLGPLMGSPVAVLGLGMAFAGLYYKLAVFPFHFWTPDVYQGASNETTSLIASLPKVGAVAVLVRFVALATPDQETIALLLAVLATASMFYGNLIALVQKDLKRLLGFSGIAHAGYALVGFVALSPQGYAAALYYIIAYLFMALACFLVVCQVSRSGANVSVEDLAGLHRRSPLLTLTLLVGVFALAGIPPFAGFTGKLTLLTAALSEGYLWLVVIAVLNTAIAIYYYLGLIRESCLRDPAGQPPIVLSWAARTACVLLIGGIVLLGVAPGRMLDRLASAVTPFGTSAMQASQPASSGTALTLSEAPPATLVQSPR